MPRPPDDAFGTDPERLARRNSPRTSVAAAEDVDTAIWEKRVYTAIDSFGTGRDEGCISDQVRRYLERFFSNIPYSSVTARYKSLEEKGLITCGPDERPGESGSMQRVMRAMPPPPDSDWELTFNVELHDRRNFVVTVRTEANNLKRAYSNARRKVVKIMMLKATNLSEEEPPFEEEGDA